MHIQLSLGIFFLEIVEEKVEYQSILGYYTPPVFEEEPIKFEKILSQSEIEAALLLEKMQRTPFSNYNCEIRSYIIEFLFKNKVRLDFLE